MANPRHAQSSRPRRSVLAVLASWIGCYLATFFAFPSPAVAQDATRSSLAGEAAAAGRRRSTETDYNLRFGPIRLKLDAGLELEFNDNVNLADSRLEGTAGPRSDFFLRPRLNIGANWQVTQINTLTLRVGVGYEFSLNNSRDTSVSPFTISPDSEISFDIFVGDFRINLHDRFSLQNDPIAQSTVGNSSNYSRFVNVSGVTVLCDLNDIVVTSTYDFTIERYTGTNVANSDRDTHDLRLSAAFLLNDTTTFGIQASIAHSVFGNVLSIEQNALAVGAFAQFQVSPYTRILVAGGYQHSEVSRPQFRASVNARELSAAENVALAAGQIQNDNANENAFYWTSAIINRLNSWFSHSLSAGHERQLGVGIGYVDIDYLRYTAALQLNRKITLQLSTGLERAEETQGIFAESLERWNFGLAFSYRLAQNLRAGVRYSYYSKESDLPFRDYQQNVIGISFFYDF